MNQVNFLFKNQLITALFFALLPATESIITHADLHLKEPIFEVPVFIPLKKIHKVIIVIPAYNEEKRISQTLFKYIDFFNNCKDVIATFLVVCNNCSDKTVEICQKIQKNNQNLIYLDLKPGGKGFAVKQGFLKALEYPDVDYIGFVDADMATKPPYFYELINKIELHDGIIASRYKQGARVWPNRPFIKEIGGKFYNWILRRNFHLDIRDTQCGAKLFNYKTIECIATHMKETGWAFDLELLYLCQLFNKDIIEIPTTWSDIEGSKLTISGCYKEFISAPIRIKAQQKNLANKLKKEKAREKKEVVKQMKKNKKNLYSLPQFLASK
jgi:dolichyl-phosphate beta-glucosyltransferase